ncbi:Cysteine-rich secretory protein 2 [Lemmus lemmus]
MADYPASWSQAVQSWYDESSNFKFGSGPTTRNAVVGHYTQCIYMCVMYMIYANIRAYREKLKLFYILLFNFSGNFVNKKNTPYTVGKPCASCPNNCEDGLCSKCY